VSQTLLADLLEAAAGPLRCHGPNPRSAAGRRDYAVSRDGPLDHTVALKCV